MLRRLTQTGLVLFALMTMLGNASDAQAAGRGQPTDWNRFNYYPYVYYPHNFQQQRGSYDHMYYRYSPEQRVPVYNKNWHNFYPTARPYHKGHHFLLDVF
jgi:hypothetical protein